MAVVASFTVEGFPELFKAMDELKEEVGKGKTDKIWRTAMHDAFRPVLDSAKHYAPSDTGQLREHIFMAVHRPNVGDKQSKYYAGEMYMARVTVSPLREDSIKTETLITRRGKQHWQTIWRNKKPVGVSQEFGNARVPPHPFLRIALESQSQVVLTILGNSLRLAIEQIAKKINKGK